MTVLNVIRRPVTVIVQGRGLMGFKGDPGNLTGPASAVDENIPIFDGVAGDKLKDSGVKLSDKADVTATNALSLVVADNQLRLSDHDNLLRGYNPTGADRVDLSSTAQEITLPANAAEGGLKVLQGGMTLTNLVTNGDFSIDEDSDGLVDNWTMATVGENGNLIATVPDPGFTFPRSTQRIGNIIASHKYYARAKIKVDSVCMYIMLALASGSSEKIKFSNIPSPNANQWYLMSGIGSYTENFTGDLWLLHRYVDAATSIGKKLEADAATGVMLIDLTAHGLDSLTVSQVDALVAAGYFSGTKSATATRIKVVDVDDERPTYQYVEPLTLRRLADGTRDTIENGTHIQRVSDDGTTALATPIVTYGVATGVPLAYPNGTITLEPVLADVGYYTDKFEISRTGYPIASLETLSIVDLATGQLTPLDISTAVIADDGLSFTHADLTAGNLVDVTYVWNYDGVYGENTFGYLDSTVVKADTANGKFYKAVPSFANGVLTWTAEEVI